jgi:RDD family
MSEPPWFRYEISDLPDYTDGAFASWSSRWRATVLDLLFALPFLVPGVVLYVGAVTSGRRGICLAVDGQLVSCQQVDRVMVAVAAALFVGGAIGYGVIYCVLTGRTGQSWGRRLMGYKLIDASSYRPIGPWQVFRRQLVGGFADNFSSTNTTAALSDSIANDSRTLVIIAVYV